MYFTIEGLRDGETAWRKIPQGVPLVFVWPAQMWAKHP
jgi:hypothetical protein